MYIEKTFDQLTEDERMDYRLCYVGRGEDTCDKDGEIIFTLHYPNDKYQERPIFVQVKEENGTLVLK